MAEIELSLLVLKAISACLRRNFLQTNIHSASKFERRKCPAWLRVRYMIRPHQTMVSDAASGRTCTLCARSCFRLGKHVGRTFRISRPV